MPRPRSDIEPRIVSAAHARFLAHGVDGASLREIARDAGTNLGMIVYYFPTKDDLFLAVVEEVYEQVLTDVEAIVRSPGSVTDRLRKAFLRIGTASARESEVFRLIVRESMSSSARLQAILRRFTGGHVPLVLDMIAEGQRTGELDAALPLPVVFAVIVGLGAVPQVLRRATRAQPPFAAMPQPEALAELSTRLLSRLFAPRDPGRGERDGR